MARAEGGRSLLFVEQESSSVGSAPREEEWASPGSGTGGKGRSGRKRTNPFRKSPIVAKKTIRQEPEQRRKESAEENGSAGDEAGEAGPVDTEKTCAFKMVLFVVSLVLVPTYYVRLVRVVVATATVCALGAAWLSLPELLGHFLSYAVSQWGLYGEVEMTFRGVRVSVWFESQRRCFGDDVRLGGSTEPCEPLTTDETFDDDEFASFGEAKKREVCSVVSMCCSQEPECVFAKRVYASLRGIARTLARAFGRWLRSRRVRVDVRAAQVMFGNPKHSSKWCRDHLCAATDVNVDLAMTVGDLWRGLRHGFEVWSPFPRDQAKRRFAAVKDDKTKTLRNSRMLGVLNIERFEMADAEVAFEQCEGRLNVAAIGARLAAAEIRKRAGSEAFAPRAATVFKTHKLNRLVVEVLAARDLDHALHGDRKPSTYARATVRAQQRRSRTIMKHASPVFAYKPEAMYITDPSSVLHIAVFEESYLGDSIVGQWATTLKRLVLDPENSDGGRGLVTSTDDAAVEWRGWLPLRDAKWRVFDRIPAHDTVPHCMREPTFPGEDFPTHDEDLVARSASSNSSPPQQRQQQQRQQRRGEDDKCRPDPREAPVPGYPAVLVRLRWERDPTLSDEFDENRALSALEQMTFNSAESTMRCGNRDLVHGMLASFPLWFDVRGGFKIHGTATAHVRDLFLGHQGELERKRRKRPEHRLLDSDWRAVKRKAITLRHLDVSFPKTQEQAPLPRIDDDTTSASTDDDHSRNGRLSLDTVVSSLLSFARHRASSSDDDSLAEVDDAATVPERPGLLTLDGATSALYRGIIDRILASGKVATSIAEVFSALSYGALMTSKGKPVVQEDAAAAAVMAAAEAMTLTSCEARKKRLAQEDAADATFVANKSAANEPSAEEASVVVPGVTVVTKLKSRAARVPFKVKGFFRFNGTRSDRQFALLVGFSEPAHKRMDARTIEDLYKPVQACGILLKTSRPPGVVGSRRWKPYRCVLRGSTLFYFELCAANGPGSHKRSNNDKIIDLHRIVADVPFAVDETDEPRDTVDDKKDDKKKSSTSLLVKIQKGRSGQDEIFLGTRLESGAIHHTYLRLPSAEQPTDDEPRSIEAVAWDAEAFEALKTPSSLENWHSGIVQAVCAERAKARAEIAKIEAEYRRKQEHALRHVGSAFPVDADPERVHLNRRKNLIHSLTMPRLPTLLTPTRTPPRGFFRSRSASRARKLLLEAANSPADDEADEEADAESSSSSTADEETKEQSEESDDEMRHQTVTKAEDAHLLFEDGSSVDLLGDRRPAPPLTRPVATRPPNRRFSALNGAWELSRRGNGLDAMLASEGVSFGARVLMCASAATLWISVDDLRATIHMQEGLIAHRFAGALNTPIRVRKFYGRDTSPFIVDTVTLSPDGTTLTMIQSSPANGKVICRADWRINAKATPRGDHLEQRIVKSKPSPYRPGLFLSTAPLDAYRRATPDRAIRIELAAAN
mmetsp:Transcript_20677/g.65019  ORF Transcript_20677/g.65019 Transcript_20677/m.65019 type:complete len:1473 (+) Transcript_20677:100-4518(+)